MKGERFSARRPLSLLASTRVKFGLCVAVFQTPSLTLPAEHAPSTCTPRPPTLLKLPTLCFMQLTPAAVNCTASGGAIVAAENPDRLPHSWKRFNFSPGPVPHLWLAIHCFAVPSAFCPARPCRHRTYLLLCHSPGMRGVRRARRCNLRTRRSPYLYPCANPYSELTAVLLTLARQHTPCAYCDRPPALQ